MGEPDVRWDAVSHEQIERWTRHGRGAAVTEQLEARLAAVTETLDDISDDVNATLQRVNGGEWTGNAATTAAAAMQAVRDFDDLMGHHGRMNVLAAFGQSDNAAWAKVNVPPYVDVRAARVPTGTPLDAVNATADYHQELQAAKDAEERARQVMREYQAMTTTRIAALPPLSPAPRVVVTTGDDIAVGPGDSGLSGGPAAPRGTRSDGDPGSGAPPAERPRDPAPGSPGAPTPPGVPTTLPAGRAGATSNAPAPDARLPTPATSPAAAAGDIGTDVVPGPLSGRGQPGGGSAGGPGGGPVGAAPRENALPIGGRGGGPGGGPVGGPGGGPVGAAPRENALRSGRRGGEVAGQAARGAGPFGVAPGATRKEEDEERRGRYAVPGSEIFEPDNDDGLLHDPFRPGSYVAPASIGDDDE